MRYLLLTIPLMALVWGHARPAHGETLLSTWLASYANRNAYVADTPQVQIPPSTRTDWRDWQPGQVVEVLPAPAASQLNAVAQSYFVRYTTRNVRGQVALASGIVLVPQVAHQRAADWPLVVYGHMTTGVADACAPPGPVCCHTASPCCAMTSAARRGRRISSSRSMSTTKPPTMRSLR